VTKEAQQVVIDNFSHSFLHEQQVEKRGGELGRWNNKDGKIVEHVGAFLELEIEDLGCHTCRVNSQVSFTISTSVCCFFCR
jgi:hypothetical protein